MVSGKNSQAAGVNRQRDVQPEFGRKIGDRVSAQIRMLFAEPGSSRRQAFVEGHHNSVVMAQECRVGSRRLQLGRGDLLQEFDRVVMGQLPKGLIQILKKPAPVGLPAPPQVISQFGQTPYASGRRAIDRLNAHFSRYLPGAGLQAIAKRYVNVGYAPGPPPDSPATAVGSQHST
jgi:hypothetical protein